MGGRVRPKRVAADKFFSYPSLRAYLRRRGNGAVVPTHDEKLAKSDLAMLYLAAIVLWV